MAWFAGDGKGAVVNQGSIVAADGGYVALLGNHVSNQGIVSARLGTIALAAGRAATLTFDGSATLQETATVLVSSGGLFFGDMAVISGFGAGDVIDFTSATSVGAAGSAAFFTTASISSANKNLWATSASAAVRTAAA